MEIRARSASKLDNKQVRQYRDKRVSFLWLKIAVSRDAPDVIIWLKHRSERLALTKILRITCHTAPAALSFDLGYLFGLDFRHNNRTRIPRTFS